MEIRLKVSINVKSSGPTVSIKIRGARFQKSYISPFRENPRRGPPQLCAACYPTFLSQPLDERPMKSDRLQESASSAMEKRRRDRNFFESVLSRGRGSSLSVICNAGWKRDIPWLMSKIISWHWNAWAQPLPRDISVPSRSAPSSDIFLMDGDGWSMNLNITWASWMFLK